MASNRRSYQTVHVSAVVLPRAFSAKVAREMRRSGRLESEVLLAWARKGSRLRE